MPLFRGQVKHIRGLTDYKDSVLVASSTNVSIDSTVSSIDGVSLSTDDRVLLTGQTNATQNGIYVKSVDGTLARSFDADSSAEVTSGLSVYVEEGTSFSKSNWLLTTTGTIVPDETSLSFTKQTQIVAGLEDSYGDGSTLIGLSVQSNGIISAVTEHALDTDNITEGSTNKFYSDTLARQAISKDSYPSNVTYDNTTGEWAFAWGWLNAGTGLSGSAYNTIGHKTFSIDETYVPTLSSGVSVFTNDAGYLTASSTDTLTNKTIGASTISGNLIPDTTETYDLGSATYRFNDLYLAGSTIDLGGAKLTNDGSDNLDIKDSSGNRKIIRASAIELVDSTGKKIKIERDATSGKMKSRKFDSSGNAEADGDDVNEISEDKTPQLGGTLDANGNYIDMGSNNITDTKVGQWDTSYGWGNHASSSYLTDYTVTESDVTGHQSALSITESQISDLGTYLPVTLSETLDSKSTYTGTELEINLNAVNTGSTGNVSNTSAYAVAISGGNITTDGSGIFNAGGSNYGNYEDIILRTNGTGTGTAGFANPSDANSIFGFRGDAGTSGYRFLTTASLNTSSYTRLGFDIIQGTNTSGGNGGENTDSGDDFKIYYSTNNGSSYTLMQTYYGSPKAYPTWTTVQLTLPTNAKASSVKFKFENVHTANGDFDHWAISKINFSSGTTLTPSFKLLFDGANVITRTGATAVFTGFMNGDVGGNVTGNVTGNQSGGSINATSITNSGTTYLNGTYTYLGNSTSDRVYVRTALFYLNNTQITSTGWEINLTDGSAPGTIVNNKAVIYSGAGVVNATTLQIAGTDITASATELNYVDGVTSNVQTQLDTKASLTGTETLDNKSIDGGSF